MMRTKDIEIEISEDDFTTIAIYAYKQNSSLKAAIDALLHEGAERIRKRNEELH